MKKSVLGVTLSSFLGFVFFLVILGFLNFINIDQLIGMKFVTFLNRNIWVIFLFSLLFYLGELFYVLKFPFSLIAPVSNAFGGSTLTFFIFRIFYFIGGSIEGNPFEFMRAIEPFFLTFVFFTVLIVGYVKIIIPKPKKTGKHKSSDVEWEDVGNEIRKALYNAAKSFAEAIKP